ncbi:hypothetical protein [Microcoleus sp. bin38.metabat.b11b12b14.051]|uniref:hypothetical protein n=1 Tax=Microcoleus sp. bin38.metabat.b11b12b14.051 TaxID=2742709 RepID=UPI0025DB0025|nr:hypothetical protein [Microcoleus sp. bin38.metabat.b11b12b14.051]
MQLIGKLERKEEGRRKKEEGRRKKEEGRRNKKCYKINIPLAKIARNGPQNSLLDLIEKTFAIDIMVWVIKK